MGLARPSGRGGIDVAHIVTYLVRAQLRQLGPHADSGGAPVAGKRAGHQTVDRHVEHLDQLRRNRARSLTGGRDLQARGVHATSLVRWPASGSATAVSTCSSTWSAVTPSLSAS